jgi:hypothetical protein
MQTVLDRHTQILCNGDKSIWMHYVRKELENEWALDELQVQRVIFDMKDEGLIY